MSRFPEEGILWRGWDDTLSLLKERSRPVLLFVANSDGTVAPFLREIMKAMPANAKLRALLHETFPALFVEAESMPEYLKELGAGSSFHIAVLSPAGLTPMVTFKTVTGDPVGLVEEIVKVLEALKPLW